LATLARPSRREEPGPVEEDIEIPRTGNLDPRHPGNSTQSVTASRVAISRGFCFSPVAALNPLRQIEGERKGQVSHLPLRWNLHRNLLWIQMTQLLTHQTDQLLPDLIRQRKWPSD
jgi:hypothetical protein